MCVCIRCNKNCAEACWFSSGAYILPNFCMHNNTHIVWTKVHDISSLVAVDLDAHLSADN